MNLQKRVEKLERQIGAGESCSVCDAPPTPPDAYDQNVWEVGETMRLSFNCFRCGRPRPIVIEMLQRREGH